MIFKIAIFGAWNIIKKFKKLHIYPFLYHPYVSDDVHVCDYNTGIFRNHFSWLSADLINVMAQASVVSQSVKGIFSETTKLINGKFWGKVVIHRISIALFAFFF